MGADTRIDRLEKEFSAFHSDFRIMKEIAETRHFIKDNK